MRLKPGTRLGAYEIVGALGAGGMGEVYRARDLRLERDIAIKVLPRSALEDESARARLVREARLAASLNHPSICVVHDVGEAEGLVYVAMELLDGRPLTEVIPDGGLPPDAVSRVGGQIAEALAHAHERGIVHRDLKAANVVATPGGRVKVLDFGLAARHVEAVNEATRSAASLDSPGVVAGTLPYMAPEALRGSPPDPKSDVWSLGVLLYELASGRRPFKGTTGVDLSSAIVRDSPPPLPPHVSPSLKAIISRCLQKEPAARYADAGQVHAALTAAEASVAQPRGWTPRLSRLIAGLGAVALIVAAIVVATRWRPAAPREAANGTINSLAVLPLENVSGEASADYLADGLTDELIGRLSKVGGLTVTARTTAMSFKGSRQRVTAIAQQLGVQAVVEGTIARSGDRIRISARLVDAASERSLWSSQYDRAATDVLVLQAEVASAIGSAIRANLSPQERGRLSAIHATSSEAYDLYLRGRFYTGRENPDAIAQAADHFERAVALDDRFAPAHAELARAYSQRLFYVTPNDASLQERAFVELERALALDPDLDSAHLAKGLLLWQSWNRFPHEAAIDEYRRAIALNPSADEAHHQLGLVYLHVGLLDEAAREFREAVRLNPANTLAQFRFGVLHLYEGQYQAALDVFKRTPSGFQPALTAFQTADSLVHLGRVEEAAATSQEYLAAQPADPGGLSTAMLAMVAATRGDADRVAALIATAREKGKGYGHFHHTAFTIARAYALIGRTADAISWLQQSADDGYPCYPVFVNDAALDRIRGEQAFQTFLAAQRARWEAFKKPR